MAIGGGAFLSEQVNDNPVRYYKGRIAAGRVPPDVSVRWHASSDACTTLVPEDHAQHQEFPLIWVILLPRFRSLGNASRTRPMSLARARQLEATNAGVSSNS
jgi:hypothetical protein